MFGDNNTRVCSTSVIITKNLHEIHITQLTPGTRPLTLFYPDNCQVIYHLLSTATICDGTAKLKPFTHVVNILVCQNSSSKYTSYVSIILLTDVNLWAKLYKQQQNIDSLSGRDATSGFFCDYVIHAYAKRKYMLVVMLGIPVLFITCCIHDNCMFTSQHSITVLFLCIHWLSRLLTRIMNELCSKL